MSPEAAKLAVQLLNGQLLKGRPMSVAFMENRKIHEVLKTSTPMPVNHDSWFIHITTSMLTWEVCVPPLKTHKDP